jgi:hypothetical protein
MGGSATASLRLHTGSLHATRAYTVSIPLADTASYAGTQQLTTTHAAIALASSIGGGGVSQQGYFIVANIGSVTGYLGDDDTGTFRGMVELQAGDIALVPVKVGKRLYGETTSGTTILDFYTLEH